MKSLTTGKTQGDSMISQVDGAGPELAAADPAKTASPQRTQRKSAEIAEKAFKRKDRNEGPPKAQRRA